MKDDQIKGKGLAAIILIAAIVLGALAGQLLT